MNFTQALSNINQARLFVASEFARAQALVHDTKTLCHFVFKDEMNAADVKKYVASVFQNQNPPRAKLYEAFLQKTLNEHQQGVFMVTGAKGIRHILAVAPCAETPAGLVYEGLIKIIGVLQAAQLYPEYFENLEKRFWELREKGVSQAQIEKTFKGTIFNYEKVKTITNAYKMMQAHTAAAVYMCLAARGTKLKENIKAFALKQSAEISNDFCTLGAGANAFAVVSKLLAQIEMGGAKAYLSAENLPDWRKIFDYTLAAVKNVGYSAHQIMDAPAKEGAFLKALVKEFPKPKERLNVLKWSAEYKASLLLQDYAAAQAFLLSN